MDRSIYDSDLDFWFNEAESFLGERSTLSSTTSALERGNAASGSFEEPFGHYILWSWHRTIDRIRACQERLGKLTNDEFRLLQVHYTASAGVGDARDIDKYRQNKQRCDYVQRLRARFGEYAPVVVYLAGKAKVDLFGVKNQEAIDEIAGIDEKRPGLAVRKLKAAHKAWRATNPKKKEPRGPKYEVPEAPLSHVA